MAWKIYRPNDGKVARWSAIAVVLAMAIFAAKSWYFWAKSVFGDRFVLEYPVGAGEAGAAIIFIGTLTFAYWLCFANPRASNFLVEVEIELRKVTWPSVKPWFSTKAEVWASTYVVLAVVFALTLFVFLVDMLFGFLSELVYYRGLVG